ncbi:MAG: DUF975 family protein [Acutalibacteraceae bacterium]
MWSRAELKLKAKESLSYFFGKGLAVCVILVSISFAVRRLYNFLMSMFGVNGAAQKNYVDYIVNYIRYGSKYAGYTEKTPTMGAIIFAVVLMLLYYAYIYFIYEPMEIGVSRFYQRSRGVTTSVSEMFSPLDYSPRIAGTVFIRDLKIFLWTLLLIVPGIIKSYEYYMVPYILAENPEISTKRAFEISKAMTDGHKWDLFVLDLSFILWDLGVVCTCGLLAVYVAPYIRATHAEAYYKLKAEVVAGGSVSLTELPDICK